MSSNRIDEFTVKREKMTKSNCSMAVAFSNFNLVSLNSNPDGTYDIDQVAATVEGLKYISKALKYLFTINLKTHTVEPRDEQRIGKRLDDGSYTGVLGLLQREEAEMSMVPVLLIEHNPVWNYAIPFMDLETCLLQAKEDVTYQINLDLFYSLRTFDALVWTLMALFLLLFLLIRLSCSNLRWPEVPHTLFQGIHVITKRRIVDTSNHTPRCILVQFLLFFSFLWMFFDAGMVNNLVEEKPGFLIDSLDDLFTPQGMKYKPIWFTGLNMHAEYANSPIGSKKRAIWQRALDNNFDGNFIEESWESWSDYLDNRERFKNTAMFDLKDLAMIYRRHSCETFNKIAHISKNTLNYLPGGLIFRLKNDSCTQYKKDVFFNKFESMLQLGFFPFLKKALENTKINELNHWQCLKPEKEFPYHKQNQVGISNIKLSLQLLSISYLIILIVFIFEKVRQLF